MAELPAQTLTQQSHAGCAGIWLFRVIRSRRELRPLSQIR